MADNYRKILLGCPTEWKTIMWSLGHLHGQGLTWASSTSDAVQDQAVSWSQDESQGDQGCAWALSLSSPCRHHQTPTLTWGHKLWQALMEELLLDYPTSQAESLVLFWLHCFWCLGELEEVHPHITLQPQFPLFHLFNPHLVAEAVARNCTRWHLMCFTGLHHWGGALLLPSCVTWHEGLPHHWAKPMLGFTRP